MARVKIHTINEKTNTDFLQKRFQAEGIEFDVVIDKPIRNRPYPYCTINDAVICTKRVILMNRNGELK